MLKSIGIYKQRTLNYTESYKDFTFYRRASMDYIHNILNEMKVAMGVFYQPVIMVLKIIGVMVLAFLTIKVGSFVIKKVFKNQKALKIEVDAKKISTMATLSMSVFRYAVYIMAGVVILTDVFNLTSVLAAAGVGGIAVGLGAQSLIKDVISGFFIVMEDQYAVGDMITIEEMTGTVENLELRVTKLRNFNGDLYIIPNGEIKKVTNHTRGSKAVIVDIPVAYNSDTEKVFENASKVCLQVSGEFKKVLVEAPVVLGITDMGRDGINLRIFAKTEANEQWAVERRIRKLIKEEFWKEGIEFYDRNRILISEKHLKGVDEDG
jgi:small-conductance mechanosensitive channel